MQVKGGAESGGSLHHISEAVEVADLDLTGQGCCTFKVSAPSQILDSRVRTQGRKLEQDVFDQNAAYVI